jgi:hypothetical protein
VGTSQGADGSTLPYATVKPFEASVDGVETGAPFWIIVHRVTDTWVPVRRSEVNVTSGV